ncbi:MAG TPA: type II CAAX endopeptidase family protein [Rubrobacteraceae bacterium]|nr:type II CAAX endopeptidase family protein [Rubrobacteraceae bacterium]
MGPRFVTFAALFYGSLTLVAVVWATLRGFDLRLAVDSLSLALGIMSPLVTVSLGLLAYRLLPVLRTIAEELAPRLLEGASRGTLVLISVLSGVGEEVFFRGAVQQEFGLVVASILFGVVHVGPDRRYLVWTVWALLAGFLFGVLYDVTGGLLAPILAHAGHNAATLLIWKRSRKGRSAGDPG